MEQIETKGPLEAYVTEEKGIGEKVLVRQLILLR